MENKEKFKSLFLPEKTALIIIDAQISFCSEEGDLVKKYNLDTSRIEKSVPYLNSFIEYCRKNRVKVIWVRQELRKDKMYQNQSARLLDECGEVWYDRPDTRDSEWHDTIIRPSDGEPIITKYSYCGFKDTDLDLQLRAGGISSVLITGYTTGVCVETTARSAYLHGYNVAVVSDCTDAHTQYEYESALTAIGTFFGWTPSSKEIEDIWEYNGGI